ncbi:hypothetical protein H4R26_005096 [Coemansia thaxteri]|uniref:Uncharacterized protein n=1 Tax=Coemansia thaxteri TaxID=2663907 RepID=A0A9W8B889_9FUNG|nr:hypothetical protein H4R26_005096 [Coemansia thaxteri]KAJ2476442.1 hypothetical protein EV174_004927 [Coemansia sp. RSA 2320]
MRFFVLLALLSCLLALCHATKLKTTVSLLRVDKGKYSTYKKSLSDSTCHDVPEIFSKSTTWVATMGNAVTFYSKKGCKGSTLVTKPNDLVFASYFCPVGSYKVAKNF